MSDTYATLSDPTASTFTAPGLLASAIIIAAIIIIPA
jgi:hypothetical protein